MVTKRDAERPAFFCGDRLPLSLKNKGATRALRRGSQSSGSSVCELVELGWECSRGFENGAQAGVPVPLEATPLADTGGSVGYQVKRAGETPAVRKAAQRYATVSGLLAMWSWR